MYAENMSKFTKNSNPTYVDSAWWITTGWEVKVLVARRSITGGAQQRRPQICVLGTVSEAKWSGRVMLGGRQTVAFAVRTGKQRAGAHPYLLRLDRLDRSRCFGGKGLGLSSKANATLTGRASKFHVSYLSCSIISCLCRGHPGQVEGLEGGQHPG